MQQPSGVPHEPVVVVTEQIDQLRVALAGEIDLHRRRCRAVVEHLEDPPVAPIVHLVVAVVALIAVIPVDEHHLPIGPDLQRDELRPRVVGEEKVGLAVPHIAGAGGREPVLVEPGAVDVVHEQPAAITIGPRAAEIDAGARVGVAAADGVRAVAVGVVPLPAGPVPVAGDRLDVVERIGIEVLARLPLIPRSLDHVVEVWNDARRLERMPQIVEVHAPRVARAFGKDFEDMPNRMVSPDAGVDSRSVGLGRARPADGGVREHAVTAVEPAIGPPDERIERLVGVLCAPAVEQDRGLGVGDVVAVGVGDEQKIGRCAHPYAAKPNRQTADEVEPLLEDLPGVERVVTVGILEDQDPVVGVFGCDLPRVGIALRNPEPAAVVEAHRDRLADVGLGREEFDGEARRSRHRPGCFQRREAIGHRHPPPRLRILPSRQRHLLPLLHVDEDALLVGDDDVGQAVACRIGGGHLHTDAGIVVDQVRHELRLAGSGPRAAKPIDHRRCRWFGIAAWSVGPVPLAGDDVVEPIAVDVGHVDRVDL